MTDTALALSVQATGVVKADGTLALTIGPSVQYEQWSDIYLSVTCTDTVLQPTCKIYNGPPVNANYLQGTEHGTNDGAQIDASLRAGQYLTALWEGATPGAVCTASVSGTRTLRGVRAYG